MGTAERRALTQEMLDRIDAIVDGGQQRHPTWDEEQEAAWGATDRRILHLRVLHHRTWDPLSDWPLEHPNGWMEGEHCWVEYFDETRTMTEDDLHEATGVLAGRSRPTYVYERGPWSWRRMASLIGAVAAHQAWTFYGVSYQTQMPRPVPFKPSKRRYGR